MKRKKKGLVIYMHSRNTPEFWAVGFYRDGKIVVV